MNPAQLFKLQHAAASAIASTSGAVRGIARKCTETSGKVDPVCKSNPSKPLAPRQLAAVTLLVSGKTICSTAKTLGVNESTIRRWKSDPRFLAEVRHRTASTPLTSPVSSPAAEEPELDADDESIEALYKEICGHVPAVRR